MESEQGQQIITLKELFEGWRTVKDQIQKERQKIQMTMKRNTWIQYISYKQVQGTSNIDSYSLKPNFEKAVNQSMETEIQSN
ncbi:hypothetical protein TTHERM_00467330 (macronuclear) [Tetrahymena thermophila SB210]|uniref:Uncharacterized protein n=1 Tax=Tetrahymena thermophila (strain SB210) TaxID=312017 RepID=I7MMG0_TETTS|nr:hypothetical protein TTHERM_00467330 [Tetrahymena thermophila SB210]EAS04784.1 hypothetical protein TTHERM_00467330 [Tetrahymena thermophila SB210]|eukprot:XP_001025029.1 hypothetical protein TTHERM_00467330 [Tetrahymena thermophila SB210]